MKRLLAALAVTFVLVFTAAAAGFWLFVDTSPLTRGEYLASVLKLRAYNWGFAELTEEEVRTLFRLRCSGRCHGTGPVETSRHTAREWQKIIDRMRVNGASVTEKEEVAIVGFLQKNYGSNVPTILSPEANRFLKRNLWKSDFGESDLYVDIIYAPAEYFDLMGGIIEGKRFDPDKNLVFMIYLNTHQDKLKPWPLKELTELRDARGELLPSSWEVTYESGDKHHVEGVLIFKDTGTNGDYMDLVLKDLPGQKERLFHWDLPIPVFEEKDDARE